jgi:spore coat protein U-like protein
MMRRLAVAVLSLLVLGPHPAAANSCSAYSSAIAFGSYSGSTVDVTGTVTVTCTSGQAYDVSLNAGTTGGATVTTRSMVTGPVVYDLGYKLFSNAARTSNWGNSSSTGWVPGTGTGG